MTRPELATAAGVSRSTIDRLELQEQLPKLRPLLAIADVLQLDLDEVMSAVRSTELAS